jgi:ribosomal protein S18 acetylase RimI-like enzyme
MIKQLDHRNGQTAADIIAVQMPAYRVEAALIGFEGIPALRDTADSIMASNEVFVGFVEVGRLAGVIAYETGEEEVDICRLVVHPEYFRRGIAAKLLEHVLEHAAAGRRTVVSTGKDNMPAISLYKRFGFVENGEVEAAPGFFIANLIRRV